MFRDLRSGTPDSGSGSGAAWDTARGRRRGLSHARRARSVPAPPGRVEIQRGATAARSGTEMLGSRKAAEADSSLVATGVSRRRTKSSITLSRKTITLGLRPVRVRSRCRRLAPHRLHDARPFPLRHAALRRAPGHSMGDAYHRSLCGPDLHDRSRVARSETASLSLNPRPPPLRADARAQPT